MGAFYIRGWHIREVKPEKGFFRRLYWWLMGKAAKRVPTVHLKVMVNGVKQGTITVDRLGFYPFDVFLSPTDRLETFIKCDEPSYVLISMEGSEISALQTDRA